MYTHSVSLAGLVCFLLSAAQCLNVVNHDGYCVVIARDNNFERCELADSNVALCKDGFVKLRSCLPGRKSCLTCLVDDKEFGNSDKYGHPVVPPSGHIWTPEKKSRVKRRVHYLGGGYHHRNSGTTTGDGTASRGEVIVVIVVFVIFMIILCLIWAYVDSRSQDTNEETGLTAIRKESI